MPMQPGLREAIMAPIKERLALYFGKRNNTSSVYRLTRISFT
jgi:hypothetical protein